MTWKLVTRSFRLLRNDPKLALFPVLSAVGAIALAVPLLAAALGFSWAEGLNNAHWGSYSWIYVTAWYLGTSFVTIFCNCALAACVQMRLAGEEPTIAGGLERAASRVHVIFLWALISTTVGRILSMIQERSGLVGKIVIAFVGVGWSLATYLIVPVLVMEPVGVMDAVRRSSSLLRQTWGEQVLSGFAFGWIALLCALPGVGLGALAMNGYPIFLVPMVLWFAGMWAAFSAAGEIFTVVLYRYATTGQAAPGYDAAMLGGAFRRK
jgi:hypothetical protein